MVNLNRPGNRNRNPPLKVILKRGRCTESIHRVHVAICDHKGHILMSAGNPQIQTFFRSSFKPFQSLSFLSSGTSEKIGCGEKGIAISCSSHTGTTMHAREAFRILWESDIDVKFLKCPIPIFRKSRLEHNCSGQHAAFLATSKKMNWPLDNYLDPNHPIHKQTNKKVSALLSIPEEELICEVDNCGAPTLYLQLSQMAQLYAFLSKSNQAELEQITRAMIAHPYLIGGEGRFDTELMKRSHGQLISKGGSEGIQCISRLGEGHGISIKVEDGSKRAKHAAAIQILSQLDWLTPVALEEISEKSINLEEMMKLEVEGELKFMET